MSNKEYYASIRRENREIGRQKCHELPKEYMFGCILYWTEGSRGRYTVDFANSDPVMIKYFLGFLRNFFNVEDKDVTININAYLTNGISLGEIETHWLELLDLPKESLRKFTNRAKYYDPNSKRKKTIKKYGVCKLRVNSSEIVEQIHGSIEEQFGVKIELKS